MATQRTLKGLAHTGVRYVGLTFIFLFSLLPFNFLSSCTPSRQAATDATADSLRYATNLTHQHVRGYSLWTMRNPWDTAAVLHRYLLVREGDAEPPAEMLTPQTSLVRVPVRRAGVATAVHCGLIDELGVGAAVAGVCEKEYIDLPFVVEGLRRGTIADFGNGMNPNIERIMDTAPDILLLTPFEHSGGYGRVERLGIPIVECAEYMEASPLARAEWMRFYAELFGAEAAADSIFGAVEADYLSLKALVADDSLAGRAKPTLLTELMYGGQWFLPCGQSTMGIMFADAGTDYLFADREGRGSVAMSFETVLDAAEDADIWLVKSNTAQPLTYRQMAEDYAPYAQFRAFRDHHIWLCDLARNHFYEQTPFHPERLLRDIISIAHPDRLPDHTPRYYLPMDPL